MMIIQVSKKMRLLSALFSQSWDQPR